MSQHAIVSVYYYSCMVAFIRACTHERFNRSGSHIHFRILLSIMNVKWYWVTCLLVVCCYCIPFSEAAHRTAVDIGLST